jgi:hypothetical protein
MKRPRLAISAGTSGGVDFVVIVAIVLALLIVWHAWRWPPSAEVTPPPPRQEMERH